MMNNVTDVNVSSGTVKGTRRRPRLKVSKPKPRTEPAVTIRLDRNLHDALPRILRPGEDFKIVDENTVVTYYRH